MPNLLDKLAVAVESRIRQLGHDEPNRRVIHKLLELAYLGTLCTEEGKTIKCSLTYASPKRPDVAPPILRRASYPAFTEFASPEILNVQKLVKFGRAIDRWSGSIAVYGTRSSEIVAWGVVDQLVQQNVMWHREAANGFANPGLLTITMDGIGDISVYHGHLFLGGVKAQALVAHEHDALNSKMVSNYGIDALAPFARAIARVVDGAEDEATVPMNLLEEWRSCIARLCIGLRQRGTGGAFLLTPNPIKEFLQVKQEFAYTRLRDAAILKVLDNRYSQNCERAQFQFIDKGVPVPPNLALDVGFASRDADDREEELTGAVKLVASLAAVDGLVLMSPNLSVAGFGVKIGSTPETKVVFDAISFLRLGTRARRIDPSQFGTRHGSMLRYCAQDRHALGIVTSQDGNVRLVMTVRNSLVFWDNIKLLSHTEYSRHAALQIRGYRNERSHLATSITFGYSKMPKTIDRLMTAATQLRKEAGQHAAAKPRSTRGRMTASRLTK